MKGDRKYRRSLAEWIGKNWVDYEVYKDYNSDLLNETSQNMNSVQADFLLREKRSDTHTDIHILVWQ